MYAILGNKKGIVKPWWLPFDFVLCRTAPKSGEEGRLMLARNSVVANVANLPIEIIGNRVVGVLEYKPLSVKMPTPKGAIMSAKFIAGEDLKKGDIVTVGDDGKMYAYRRPYSDQIAAAIYEYFAEFMKYPERIHVSRGVYYQLLNEKDHPAPLFGLDKNMTPNTLMGFPFETHRESDRAFWLEPELKANANP